MVELGCASGYPVGIDLVERGLNYTGIDLSSTQIDLARQQYETHQDRFVEADMMEYLEETSDDSLDGIISLFTIFHLPRGRHIDLFAEVKRVLRMEAVVLFTAHRRSWEGVNDDFFGIKMVWSNFSYKFYQLMLHEMNFTEIMTYRNVQQFRGEDEETYFLLFENL